MNKEVLITITGIQLGEAEEAITRTASGTYHFANGKHYIQYDERGEDSNSIINNTLKITPDFVTLTKKEDTNTHQKTQMVFDLSEVTQTLYPTPYGSLPIEIKTKQLHMSENDEKIELVLFYTLSAEASLLSENQLTIIIEDIKK